MRNFVAELFAQIDALWAALFALGAAFLAGVAFGRFFRPPPSLAPPPPTALSNNTLVEPALLWRKPFTQDAIQALSRPAQPPVLVLANLKGGVGKSTTAVNLAAYFAEKRGLRTLLLDLDYQGTSTDICYRQALLADRDSRVNDILLRGFAAEQPAIGIASLANLKFYSANETLDDAETSILLREASSGRNEGDVRLALHSFLRSPAVLTTYDLIICDTAPRFSAATVNALVAGTHLLVPSKLDAGSDDATVRFVDKIQKLSQGGYPGMRMLGVLPSMTQQRPNLAPGEILAANRIDDRLSHASTLGLAVIREAWVPDSAAIVGPAREGIAYLRNPTARAIYDEVGDVIHRRVFA